MSALARLLFNLLVRLRILSPVLKPLVRLFVSVLAIPVFRLVMRRVAKQESLSRELQKDLEQWFRGAMLLLIATPYMEEALFSWIPAAVRNEWNWLAVGMRIMLAIGVIEGMPDQALFSIIHPGPSMLLLPKGRRFRAFCENWRALLWGVLAKHLNRSSPVFAIMAVLFDGPVGWACYWLAVVQYLIIGLVSSRDAAMDAMEQFDREMAARRAEVLSRVHEPEEAPDLLAAPVPSATIEPPHGPQAGNPAAQRVDPGGK